MNTWGGKYKATKELLPIDKILAKGPKEYLKMARYSKLSRVTEHQSLFTKRQMTE